MDSNALFSPPEHQNSRSLQSTPSSSEIILPNDRSIHVTAAHHPFKTETVDLTLPAGLSITEILEIAQPDPLLRQHGHIFIDDQNVPKEYWDRVRPKPNTKLTIRVLPSGGGGKKNPLRLILTIALIAITSWFGGTTAIGMFGELGAKVLGAVVGIVGNLIINALAPPPKPKFVDTTRDSPTLFIEGARNQANPFGAVPRVLGKHRMVPPFAALPYTSSIGNDQYLHLLFTWGYAPLEISDLRIGETPLEDFEDVEIQTLEVPSITEPFNFPDFPHDIFQDVFSAKLANDPDTDDEEEWVTRTTQRETNQISIDLRFPQGLVHFNNQGGKVEIAVEVIYEYRLSAEPGQEENDWVDMLPNGLLAWRIAKEVVGKSLNDDWTDADFSLYFAELSSIKDDLHQNFLYYPSNYPYPYGYPHRINYRYGYYPTWFFRNGKYHPSVYTSGILNEGETLSIGRNSIRAMHTSAVLKAMAWAVPNGQYDVRIRRVTRDSTSDRTFDEVFWTALRSNTGERPVNKEGIIATSLKIKETDQLNGVIDQFNGIVESKVPVPTRATANDPFTWDEENPTLTSNPAALYRSVLTDAANARPLNENRIDDQALGAWYEFCEDPWEGTANGKEPVPYRFNQVVDYRSTVRELLSDIASTGRASPATPDGKWSVTIDGWDLASEAKQTIPVQHFTPRNSWDFNGEKVFQDIPHAFRVRFSDETQDYRQEERIVYDYAYSETGEEEGKEKATKFEGLELPGITDPDLIWIHARYHIASARLRPETYSFSTDIEHIVCTRGDLIRVTHDVPLWGISVGRIKSIQTDNGSPEKVESITLDESCTMESGKSYSIRIRTSTGDSISKNIVTQAGVTNTLTFSTPFNLENTISVGDLASFGEQGQESVELVVKSIEPGPDLSARIVCLDAAKTLANPSLITEDENEVDVANYIPQITLPPNKEQITFEKRPDAPIIQSIRSDESVLLYGPDGTLKPRVLVSLRPQPTVNAVLRVIVRDNTIDKNEVVRLRFAGSPTEVSISEAIEEGVTYNFSFTWVTESRQVSKSTRITHTVTGRTNRPSNIERLSIEAGEGVGVLRWNQRPELDVKFGGHIKIRHSPKTSGATWGTSTSLGQVSGSASDFIVPLLTGTYLARPFDATGRTSHSATSTTSKQISLSSFTQKASVTEHPEFSGTKDNTITIDNGLYLKGLNTLDDIDDFDSIKKIDFAGGVHAEGTYLFDYGMDFSSATNVRLTKHIEAEVTNPFDLIDEHSSDIDNWDDFDGTEGAEADAQLWIRQTNDDPTGSPSWSEWSRLHTGVVQTRALEFKAELTTENPDFNIRIDELSVIAEELV